MAFYNYHPMISASARLGYGLNANEPDKAKIISPFVNPYATREENNQRQDIFISIVNNETSLLDAFRLDASIDVRFPKFKLKSSLSIDESEIYNENNLTICLTAIAEFGQDKLLDPTPTKDAKQLISDKQFDKFINKYGHYVVFAIDRKMMAFVFVTLKNVDKVYKKAISGSITGKYGTKFSSVKADVELSKIINQSFINNEFTLRSYTVGDFDIDTLPEVAKDIITLYKENKNFVESSYEVLQYYLSAMDDRSRSAITGYHFTDYTFLNIPRRFYLNLFEKYEKYANLCGYYKNYVSYADLANAIQANVNYLGQSSNYAKVTLQKEMGTLRYLQDNIVDAMSKCLESKCELISNCCNLPKNINFVYDDTTLRKLVEAYFNDPLSDFNKESIGAGTYFFRQRLISPFQLENDIYNYYSFNENLAVYVEISFNISVSQKNEVQNVGCIFYVNDKDIYRANGEFAPNRTSPMLYTYKNKLLLSQIGGLVRKFHIEFEQNSPNVERVNIDNNPEFTYIKMNYTR